MENWIIRKADGNPGNVTAGYTLQGKALSDYSDECFTAPFIAGAAVDPAYQDFLDSGWDLVRNDRSNSNYFNDTVTMLVLLLVSEIWQAPQE